MITREGYCTGNQYPREQTAVPEEQKCNVAQQFVLQPSDQVLLRQLVRLKGEVAPRLSVRAEGDAVLLRL